MGRMPARTAAAVLAAALADYLLYGRTPGCNVTIFAAVLALALGVRYHVRFTKAVAWTLLWFGVALGAAVQSSVAGIVVLFILGWAVLAKVRLPRGASLFEAAGLGFASGLRTFVSPLEEFFRRRLVRARARGKPGVPIWVIAVPAALILVFGALVIPANLVLADYFKRFFEQVGEWLRAVTAGRVFLWLFVGAGVFGLLGFRVSRLLRKISEVKLPAALRPGDAFRANELVAAVATFVGLNVILLAANLTDAAYLWFSLKLPAGLTYAYYAQRGSYRLIAAAVLAALVMAVFFRGTALVSQKRFGRALAFAFIVQNLIVLAGAARRLELYVEVYGLTRMRVAAFLWMLLVLAGFVIIAVKIARNAPFVFLLKANAVSVALLLSVVSILNINGFIARWNVSMFESGARRAVDVGYLGRLGSSALPSLARLAQGAGGEISRAAAGTLEEVLLDCESRRSDWRSWTLRSANDISAGRRAYDDLKRGAPWKDAGGFDSSGPPATEADYR